MKQTHCPRCAGLLVIETAIEDAKRYEMQRCPLCGFYTDETMETNRRISSIAPLKTPWRLKGVRI